MRALDKNNLSDFQAKKWGDLFWELSGFGEYVGALCKSTHTTVVKAVNDAYQERFGE